MDPSAYKEVVTKRGIKYSYYVSHGDESKPALLFNHGFPSSSFDWRNQVPFFQKEGYTVIAPDLLGYGGTDKPSDPAAYKYSAMCADLIDILDAEKVEKAIAIGHDWGCAPTSRLASYYPERFVGYAFLAVGYSPPSTNANFEDLLALTEKLFGYETFGYWLFFNEDESYKDIEAHLDSFLRLLYPGDPKIWQTDMAPRGGMKAWVLGDKKAPLPSYISEEDKNRLSEILLKGGFQGPTNWYKLVVRGIAAEDNKNVPQERYAVQQPTFFAACKKDYVCLPALGQGGMAPYCPNLTVKEFDSDHWVQLAQPDELNKALLEWIEGSVKTKL